jgi:hypothetical protein
MGQFFLPVAHTVHQTRGAATGVAIPVPSIRSASPLLAVISVPQAGGAPVGRAVSAFSVANGSITSASINTSADFLVVIFGS